MTPGNPILSARQRPSTTRDGALQARTLLPLAWSLLLVLSPLWGHSLRQRWNENSELKRQLQARQATLDQLRAVAVAARIEGREYDDLLLEFASLTGLRASDPFRDPAAEEPSSIQVAALVRAVQEASWKESDSDSPSPITLLSVTPGARQRLGPFLMTEFELNLEGRFHSLSDFLDLLTQVGRNRRLAISIGSLKLSSQPSTAGTGTLSITLPVRAYFRE